METKDKSKVAIFFISWLVDAMKYNRPEGFYKLMGAVVGDFLINGEDPTFEDDLNSMLFDQFKRAYIENIEKRKEASERNRVNGLNGGAPKGNANARKQPKTEKNRTVIDENRTVIDENPKQPKTTENNRKQPKTTENNPKQPKTTENNRKQPKTTENNPYNYRYR